MKQSRSNTLVFALISICYVHVSVSGKALAQEVPVSGNLRIPGKSFDPSPAELEEQEEQEDSSQDLTTLAPTPQTAAIQLPEGVFPITTAAAALDKLLPPPVQHLGSSSLAAQATMLPPFVKRLGEEPQPPAEKPHRPPPAVPSGSQHHEGSSAAPSVQRLRHKKDPASVDKLFPKSLPAASTLHQKSAAVKVSAFHSSKRANFDPLPVNGYNECNPPCIIGRGVCNDNMCFCKSPYVGTTCQHKMDTIKHFSYPMLFAFAMVSAFFGGLLAQLVHAAVYSYQQQQRSEHVRDGTIFKEVWAPPLEKGKSSHSKGRVK